MRLDVCEIYRSEALFRLFVQNHSAFLRLQRTDNSKKHFGVICECRVTIVRRQFIIEKRDVAGKYVFLSQT